MVKKFVVVMFVVFAAISSNAYAISDLSGYFTTDNHYSLYLSTDDSSLGTLIGSSDGTTYDWASAENIGNWGISLTPNTTNYLHIVAWDDGSTIAGILGDLTLNNSSFIFANGNTSLLTNTTDWTVRKDSFATSPIAIVNAGGFINSDTDSPWYAYLHSPIDNIGGDAQWLWTNEGGNKDLGTTRYFSTAINTVPEPISTALFLLGGATLAVRRIRRK